MNCPDCQRPINPTDTKVTITGQDDEVAVHIYCLHCVRFVYTGVVGTLKPVLFNRSQTVRRQNKPPRTAGEKGPVK